MYNIETGDKKEIQPSGSWRTILSQVASLLPSARRGGRGNEKEKRKINPP
jgi:hypothetical protein